MRTIVVLCCAVMFASSVAQADADTKWHGQVAGGGDFGLAPEVVGFGWVLFQATRADIARDADLRLYYNTDTVEVGLDRLSFGKNFEFSVALRAEFIFAGLLRYYYQQGKRVDGLGFNASYVVLLPKIQWHAGDHHTLELLTNVRYWFFGSNNTDPTYLLPRNSWVFEPRLGYIYWNVTSPSEEWGADRLFPRIEGVAVGAWIGVDVRSNITPWGLPDGRNDPSKGILTINQWLKAGWRFGDRFRLELGDTANWGEGQDDITRMRVAGMNPYVVVVPGLPWSAILSERLFVAQVSGNVRVKKNKPQELGLLISGGTVNDPFRVGDLKQFGGIGGVAITTDLRWGIWQVYARVGYAFPANWMVDNPYFAMMAGLGVNAF
ncbi:MAG: hypothetical protein OEQ49_15940 [Myxococcales bacterium]|nr:hypothetical protein [Myxococcales bacterium]